MKRGRKPGNPHRWNAFSDAQLWSHLEHIRTRDKIDLRAAAHKLALLGYFQFRAGKLWITRPPTAKDANDQHITRIMNVAKIGDARIEDPSEAFRARYYAVERKRKLDPAFRRECDLWLRVRRQTEGVLDPIDAFFEATQKNN